MAITGTITAITPRWLRAAPGLLAEALGRTVATARGRMRAAGQIVALGVVAAIARRLRRVVPETIAITGSLSAIARRLRRIVPEAAKMVGVVSGTAHIIRTRTLSDGTLRTLSTSETRTFLEL